MNPTRREAQLLRLLSITTRQIAEAEERLLEVHSDAEMRKALERVAELHVSRRDIGELLQGESREKHLPSAQY